MEKPGKREKIASRGSSRGRCALCRCTCSARQSLEPGTIIVLAHCERLHRESIQFFCDFGQIPLQALEPPKIRIPFEIPPSRLSDYQLIRTHLLQHELPRDSAKRAKGPGPLRLQRDNDRPRWFFPSDGQVTLGKKYFPTLADPVETLTSSYTCSSS